MHYLLLHEGNIGIRLLLRNRKASIMGTRYIPCMYVNTMYIPKYDNGHEWNFGKICLGEKFVCTNVCRNVTPGVFQWFIQGARNINNNNNLPTVATFRVDRS
jgi:hypothetical protein